MSDKGVKLDAGKPRWSLVPWDAVARVVRVLEYGARKYSPGNWQHVPDARTRYFDALMRHVLAWRAGELVDAESGEHHLAHAACCVLFLLAFEARDEFEGPAPGVYEHEAMRHALRPEGCYCLPGTICARCQAEIDKAVKGEG